MGSIGSGISVDKVSTLLLRAKNGLILVAFLGAACLVATVTTYAETCSGPPSLEARLHAHPNADNYSVLGNWFSENHQADCAAQAFQAALKIDSASKKALDGLAKGLIAAGDYGTVIRHLRTVPLDENLTLDLAIAYRMADMFDDAEKVLTEGLKSYPNSDGLTGALVSLDIHVGHSAGSAGTGGKTGASEAPRYRSAARLSADPDHQRRQSGRGAAGAQIAGPGPARSRFSFSEWHAGARGGRLCRGPQTP